LEKEPKGPSIAGERTERLNSVYFIPNKDKTPAPCDTDTRYGSTHAIKTVQTMTFELDELLRKEETLQRLRNNSSPTMLKVGIMEEPFD